MANQEELKELFINFINKQFDEKIILNVTTHEEPGEVDIIMYTKEKEKENENEAE